MVLATYAPPSDSQSWTLSGLKRLTVSASGGASFEIADGTGSRKSGFSAGPSALPTGVAHRIGLRYA